MNWTLIGLVVAACAGFTIYTQAQGLATVKAINQQQRQKLEDYAATTERLTNKFVAADAAMTILQAEDAKGDHNSGQRTTIIKQTLVGNNCADQLIPVDTLRVQQEGTRTTNERAGVTYGAVHPAQ